MHMLYDIKICTYYGTENLNIQLPRTDVCSAAAPALASSMAKLCSSSRRTNGASDTGAQAREKKAPRYDGRILQRMNFSERMIL